MYEHITVHEAAVEGKIPRALLFLFNPRHWYYRIIGLKHLLIKEKFCYRFTAACVAFYIK